VVQPNDSRDLLLLCLGRDPPSEAAIVETRKRTCKSRCLSCDLEKVYSNKLLNPNYVVYSYYRLPNSKEKKNLSCMHVWWQFFFWGTCMMTNRFSFLKNNISNEEDVNVWCFQFTFNVYSKDISFRYIFKNFLRTKTKNLTIFYICH